jgi:hypothetical protein
VPEQLAGMSDGQIAEIVAESDRVGRVLGIRSERAHARWAYLMMLSGGLAARTREATEFIRQGPNPDENVKILVDETAAAIRRGAGES